MAECRNSSYSKWWRN